MERLKWRAAVRSGAKSHKTNSIVAAEQRRQDRKSSAAKSDRSHHSLSILHQNLLSADWPDQSSPHPQERNLPATGSLDGPRRIDGQAHIKNSLQKLK